MRALKLLAAVSVTAAMAGCASAKAAAPAASTQTASPSASVSAGASQTPGTSADKPSASALMVCGPEIRNAVATILALPAAPATTATWADHLYTCTYHLASGTLVLSVKESPDTATANAYFAALRQRLGSMTSLTGAQGLGNPGYQNAAGNVVLLKDAKTLRVDATALPAASGPSKLPRADVAYEIATDIIGCWTGK